MLELTHELVHRITPGEIYHPENNSSAWYTRIEEILGQPFPALAYSILNSRPINNPSDFAFPAISAADQDYYNMFYAGFTETIFTARGPRSLPADTPIEFIANLGIFYLEGENFFNFVFSKFFGSGIVDSLYAFTRNDIFKGKEYPSFPLSAVD